MTHAYFKAMMFLGSGSVIHGMEEVVGHDPDVAQDMRVMGGLRKYMPITAITFFIGTLAISGIPPFAGFWSKDEILASTFRANPLLWAIGFATAGLTAFYMFRMYFTTFEGDFRGTDKKLVAMVKAENSAGKEAQAQDGHSSHHASKPHESPITMTFPLMVLAIPSMLVGLVGTPLGNYFEYFIHAPSEKITEVPVEGFTPEFLLMGGSSVGIGLIGISFAILMYMQKKIDPSAIAKAIQPIYNLSKNKWYIDEIYGAVFVTGSRRLARQVLEVDAKIVDGVVNLAGFVTVVSGEGLKYFENGKAQFYALVIFIGVLGLVIATSI
jgi:NAD(P)H-quinone oxidoreductase subunit 5